MAVIKRWVLSCSIAACFLFTLYYLTGVAEPYLAIEPTEKPLRPPATSSFSVPSETTTPSSPSSIPSTSTSSYSSSLDHGKFWWNTVSQRYPVTSMIPLPTGEAASIPKIQHKFKDETPKAKRIRESRLETVRESFKHTWEGYKKHAWMKDEVAPITAGYKNTFGGWAATLVDTLDTLWIMDMHDECEEAVEAVTNINFTKTDESTLNVFETTIRYLGGFLAAYDLSNGKYPVLLEKAVEVGDMLYVAFDTPNRMPLTRWDWRVARAGQRQEAGESVLVAELGSLSVEFTRLSQLTKDPKYFDAVQRITNHFDEQQNATKLPGMWPVVVNAKTTSFTGDTAFTLGGMSDSVYEYLPKEYLLLGGVSPQYRKLYEKAIDVVKKHIFYRPMTKDNRDVLLSGNVRANPEDVVLEPQGQHLACFTGGMVGIGAKIFDRPDDLAVARKLVDGCIWAYGSMQSGIMPETFHVVPCTNASNCDWDESKWYTGILGLNKNDDEDAAIPHQDQIDKKVKELRLVPGFTAIGDKRYILRPEAVESIFILYRITGDTGLQDQAWTMFQAIEKHTRTEIANAAIDDVTVGTPLKSDRMESFWTAETLKYFYLLYSDPNLVNLDEYVLNTEAHPLRRPRVG